MTYVIGIVIIIIIGIVGGIIKDKMSHAEKRKENEKIFEEKQQHYNEENASEIKPLYSTKFISDDVDAMGVKSKRHGSTVAFYQNCVRYNVFDLRQQENMRVAFVLSRRYKWPESIEPETTTKERTDEKNPAGP